jgi:hypothetical protein
VGVSEVAAPDRSRTATELTVAALRDVAGTQLYRRNAFRVTGLLTVADRQVVRRRQRQVLPALEAGADVDIGLPVGLDEVRAAFDRLLESPHRRLVDELFWLWGDATDACGCPATLHQHHDEAVRAHSAALDLEAKGKRLTDSELDEAERLWSTASRQWATVLRHDRFWTHVLARIEALGERQLDRSVVDELRERLPLALFQPLLDLAATPSEEQEWLVEQAHAWRAVPQESIDHLLETAATPHYDAAGEAVTEAADVLRADGPERGAAVVYQQVIPALRRLKVLVPHRRHRRTARLRDRAALVLNNCATTLIDRDGPASGAQAQKWLETARRLTTDQQTLDTIAANRATVAQMMEAFAAIKSRVAELKPVRPDLARSLLLDIKRQLGGGPGTEEIDRMLADLNPRQPRRAASPPRTAVRRPPVRAASPPRTAVRRPVSVPEAVAEADRLRRQLNRRLVVVLLLVVLAVVVVVLLAGGV